MTSPSPYEPSPDLLPVAVLPAAVVGEQGLVVGRALARSIGAASAAVHGLPSSASSDVTVSTVTALVCAGSTPADALQAAADVARQAPTLHIHSIAWARVPGPAENSWEWHATLTVSARDSETGEYDGSTHQADRRA